MKKQIITALLGLGVWLSGAHAMALASVVANTFTPEQKSAIEKIVHDYLIAHPTVLIEATQALQAQQQKEMISRAQTAIKENATALFNNSQSPILGATKGDVTLIEFFDYQCSVCQHMAPVLKNLIQKNPHLRVVIKEWPIFGKTSEEAAIAALAAVKQNKFDAYYEALIMHQGALSEAKIFSLARHVGLNTKKLRKDMKDPAYSEELKNNLKLAEAMRLVGTPAFVIAHTPQGVYKGSKAFFVPGAASEEALQELIGQAQK